MAELNWTKASFCAAGNCVEVAATPDGRIAIRDASGSTLEISAEAYDLIMDAGARGDLRRE